MRTVSRIWLGLWILSAWDPLHRTLTSLARPSAKLVHYAGLPVWHGEPRTFLFVAALLFSGWLAGGVALVTGLRARAGAAVGLLSTLGLLGLDASLFSERTLLAAVIFAAYAFTGAAEQTLARSFLVVFGLKACSYLVLEGSLSWGTWTLVSVYLATAAAGWGWGSGWRHAERVTGLSVAVLLLALAGYQESWALVALPVLPNLLGERDWLTFLERCRGASRRILRGTVFRRS